MLSPYKKLVRYKEIISILLKYGLSGVLLFIKSDLKKRFGRISEPEKQPKGNIYQNIRLAFEELGPTFIKFGQFLSTKEHWLPREMIKELTILQDSVTPVAFEKLKHKIDFSLFKNIEKQPIASASLSQIYKAELKSGENVVIKVKRPGVEDIIHTDFEILREISAFLQHYKIIPEYANAVDLVDEFRAAIEQELDFYNEARNIKRFYEFFQGNDNIIIPQCFIELCSQDMLVIEYIAGQKISDALDSGNVDREKIAKILLDATFQQFFVFSYFHGDPHPANIFVVDKKKIALLDFGLIGYVDSELKDSLKEAVIGIYRENYRQLLKVFLKLDMVAEDTDLNALRRDLELFIVKYKHAELAKIRFNTIFEEAYTIMRKHRLSIPRQLALMMRAIGLIEGLSLKIFPETNMAEVLKKYGKLLLLEELSLKKKYQKFASFLYDIADLIRGIPENVEMILWKIRKGELRVKFDLTEMQDMMNTLERITNRFILGMLLAAMILASSLLARVSFGPKLYGFSVLSIISIVISFFLAIILAISILRSRFK